MPGRRLNDAEKARSRGRAMPSWQRAKQQEPDCHNTEARREHRGVECQPGRGLGVTGEPDREQRRRGDRQRDCDRRAGRADQRDPGKCEYEALPSCHPKRAKHRRFGRVGEDLARQRLTSHERDRQRDDRCEQHQRE